MKNWLKWGLIFAGIGLVIDLFFFDPMLFMMLVWNSCYSSHGCSFLDSLFNNANIPRIMIVGYTFDLIIYFLMGALIGWLINRNKSTKK